MVEQQCLLSGMYTDDWFVFGAAWFVARESRRFADDAVSIVGEGAINATKTLKGSCIDIIGMSNDLTSNHSIGLSGTIYLKLVCAMFVMLDMDLRVGDRVLVKTLQSVASRVLRSADVVQVMGAYSRGFSDNMKKLPAGAEDVALSPRAFHDLQMWRVVLELGFTDRRWLRVPIRVPLLHRYLVSEDPVQRAHRQAAAADFVVFADACTSHGHGMGYFSPGVGWNSTSLPELRMYCPSGNEQDVDINILEFIAGILAVCSLLPAILARQAESATHAHLHVHLWTDNTACMAWILTHRTAHPLHLFLCQVMSLLRVLFNITLTSGHLPGKTNSVADPASRQFDQLEDIKLLEELSLWPRLPFPSDLTFAIVEAAMPRCEDTSQPVLAVLTALGGVRGWATLPPTVSTPSFRELCKEFHCGP